MSSLIGLWLSWPNDDDFPDDYDFNELVSFKQLLDNNGLELPLGIVALKQKSTDFLDGVTGAGAIDPT